LLYLSLLFVAGRLSEVGSARFFLCPQDEPRIAAGAAYQVNQV
jgi:hypothetical protein